MDNGYAAGPVSRTLGGTASQHLPTVKTDIETLQNLASRCHEKLVDMTTLAHEQANRLFGYPPLSASSEKAAIPDIGPDLTRTLEQIERQIDRLSEQLRRF